MKESFSMSPDDELVITLEAETPEDMAELKDLALEAVRTGVPAGESLTLGSDDDEVTVNG